MQLNLGQRRTDKAPVELPAHALLRHMMALGSSGSGNLDPRKLRTACQRMARLEVGARRLLFHEGLPVDIDMLLGRDERPNEPDPGPLDRTRVSVIYLNTLHSQDDKDFFVATLVERLYEWMLRHPSPDLQALFYIDEIAPFMPPVRKPACKAGLQLLFKQARKYGVGCLMATQNPGDVDYKAMATHADDILADLPTRRPGEFTVLAPDHFPAPVELANRWLYSAHETLDEAYIERLNQERWRDRFSTRERAARPAPATQATAGKSATENTAKETTAADTLPAKQMPGKKPTTKKPTTKKSSARRPATEKPATKTLQLLCFSDRRGIEFVDDAGDYASQIDDFDGFARFDDGPPGTIAIDEDAWRKRRDEAEVAGYFRERFAAEPGQISPVFVPLWHIHLRQTERGNVRLLAIDGLVGKPVSWPEG